MKRPSLFSLMGIFIILPDELLQKDKHLRKYRILYKPQGR